MKSISRRKIQQSWATTRANSRPVCFMMLRTRIIHRLLDLNRKQFTKVLRKLPDSTFSRTGMHSERGIITLGQCCNRGSSTSIITWALFSKSERSSESP